jgi:uncharacterized membrane protein
MSLINPAIMYAIGLAAIPVVLHFLMRSKPKKLLFPALRFVLALRNKNTRRMRLRHIWLLLLRVAVIVLLVLAIARPSLPAANYAPTWGETLALLAILALLGAVYWGASRLWQRSILSRHELNYRGAMLRGGTGGVGLLLLLLLFVWPYQRRIAAEISAPMPEVAEDLPVAAVFLFDTSLSMQYRLESKTRLEVAQNIAEAHLSGLPAGSRIAVAHTAADNPVLFQANLSGAQAQIEKLKERAVSVPLNERVLAALNMQDEDRRRTLQLQESVPEENRSDRYLREIYLFTDLARSGWKRASAARLRERLAGLPWLQVYLIDVGVVKPTNLGISSLRISRQTVPVGGRLVVEATIDATGIAEAPQTVELYVQNSSGKPVKQGESPVSLDSKAGTRIAFSVHPVARPISQGEVRLISSDPLPADDVAYFTVAVRPPPEVLVVAETRQEAAYWTAALAPQELVRSGQARYRTTYLPASRLAEATLDRYDAVCLMDLSRVAEDSWSMLARFVESGGGLAVFLGMPNTLINPTAVAYNQAAAQEVLPASLLADLRFAQPQHLNLDNRAHPIFQKFEDLGGVGELTSVGIYRYWRVQPNDAAYVIAKYTDPQQTPALLERSIGSGRCVMLTTAVDLDGWSDLPRADWSFVAFADQLMQYLGRSTHNSYNYLAGDEVVLPLQRNHGLTRYLLRKPELQQLPGDVTPDAELIVIDDADQIGHYEVIDADPASSFHSGFSANPSPGESDFRRADVSDLDEFFGEDRYTISRDVATLRRLVAQGRVGQEMYAAVLLFLVVAFCLEHIVANRFYDSEQSPEH